MAFASQKYFMYDGDVKYFGFLIDLMDTFASHMNFTVFYDGDNPNLSKYFLGLSSIYSTIDNERCIGEPFMFDSYSFLIPPGESFSNFEKLFLPFHSLLWLMLAFSIIFAIIVINIVNKFPKNVQIFVYGETSTPVLNIFIAIFGMSQSKLPKTNFARFLLMAFLLFTLIFRYVK